MALVFNEIMAKVSIIIPVYNLEKYIGRAIESLINQSFGDIEIIVVNDGSSDNSLNEIYKFEDNRIKVYSQQNQGSAIARNLGIDKSTGEYIMFLDGDDFYQNNCIEKAYNKIVLDNSDICIYGSKFINNKNECIKTVIPSRKEKINLLYNKDVYLEIENCTWDKIYKSSIIKENNIKYPEGLYYQDFGFTFSLLKCVNTISFINEELVCYIAEREGNETHDISDRVFDIFNVVDFIIDSYKKDKKYSKFKDEIKAISIINIVDRLKQVVLSKNKKLKERFIKHCYEFIKNRFLNFKSKYNLLKHPNDYIYFNKNLLKLYMIAKGMNR